MLDSTIPHYKSRLGNKLCYEISFKGYDEVTVSGKPDAKYEIWDISLEYEIVTHPDLARHVSVKYEDMILPYDRILNHIRSMMNKSDMTWNWSFDMPCKSLKGILVRFEEEKSFA